VQLLVDCCESLPLASDILMLICPLSNRTVFTVREELVRRSILPNLVLTLTSYVHDYVRKQLHFVTLLGTVFKSTPQHQLYLVAVLGTKFRRNHRGTYDDLQRESNPEIAGLQGN
jgi:hypothetical protein